MNYNPHENSPEARSKRAQRTAAKRLCMDQLQQRERIALFWTKCNETNKHYGLVHSRAFFRNTCFFKYLMPLVREHIQSQYRAERQHYIDALRESTQRAALAKALAKAGPMPLFEQVAA